MPDNITLEFISAQMQRVLDEMRQVRAEQSRTRDSITVLTGITIRLEGAVSGLTMEIAGLRSMVLDHDRKLMGGA